MKQLKRGREPQTKSAPPFDDTEFRRRGLRPGPFERPWKEQVGYELQYRSAGKPRLTAKGRLMARNRERARIKRCLHDKRLHACRTETDEHVTGFVVVCATCGMMRRPSTMWRGLWLSWEKIRTSAACIKSFPPGARFTVLWTGTREQDAIGVLDATIEAMHAGDGHTSPCLG
jgi:hypothetical protein